MIQGRTNEVVESADTSHDYTAQFAHRGRLQRRLLIAILALCVAAGLWGWFSGPRWLAMSAFACWIVTWLGSGYVFNRCPRCRKFLDGRMAGGDFAFRDDPFVCPHCGARLRRTPT